MQPVSRRRYFRKQYQQAARKKVVKKPYQLLQQPDWDDTIHDLTQLKLSPEEQLRRRLSRISKHQPGVALLDRLSCSHGSASSRYTPSIGSTKNHDQTDSDDDSRSEKELVHQSRCMAMRKQQAGREGLSDNDTDDDMCQWQDAANSPLHQRAVLGDIANTTRTKDYEHESHSKQMLRHPGAVVHADAAQGIPQVSAGHIAVPSATLQALFDKIDSLEQQLNQQQQGSTATQQSHQLQQQAVTSQQELSETQQQLADLQAAHRQYVSQTSSLLMRLQAQLQELTRQSPNHTGAVELGNLARQLHISETATASSASLSPAVASSHRQASDSNSRLRNLGPAPLGSSAYNSGGEARSPSKQHLRAVATVATTASPHKSVTGLGTDLSQGAATSATAGFGRPGGAAAAAVDAVALPSYAEMRQRTSKSRASTTGLGPVTAQEAATASATAERWTRAAAAAGTISTSMAGELSSSNIEAAVPADGPGGITSSVASIPPFSKPVHHPLMTSNASASATDELSSRAAAVVQQQHHQAPGYWSNAAQVAPVIADFDMDASAAMLNPSLTAATGLPGLRDADWGLQPGLPMAAIGRVFTDAGRLESMEMPKPRVRLDQLKGNMSLSDHLRAAKSLSGAFSGVKALGL